MEYFSVCIVVSYLTSTLAYFFASYDLSSFFLFVAWCVPISLVLHLLFYISSMLLFYICLMLLFFRFTEFCCCYNRYCDLKNSCLLILKTSKIVFFVHVGIDDDVGSFSACVLSLVVAIFTV